jgi:VanZ family protein
LLSYYFGQKHYPVPYDLKKILSYLGLSIVLSIIALNTGSNYYINTSLVFLFLGIVFLLEKKELKQLLNSK